MKRKSSESVSSIKVRKYNEGAVHINSLPEEIFLKIFSYLKQYDLCRISRVCKKWNAYIRTPILWKKVDVMFRVHYRHKFKAAKYIIQKLPSCLTHIRLDFRGSHNWSEPLNFEEFSASLQKCPLLQTLVLYHARLSSTLPSVIDLCSHFLEKVRTLVLRYSTFENYSTNDNYNGTSKIEILDLCGCELGSYNKPTFSRMPYLKKLYLAHSITVKNWFESDINFLTQLEVLDIGHTDFFYQTFHTIQSHVHQLKELYMTSLFITDQELNVSHSTFPHLEIISVKNCVLVTCNVIISLIRKCQSLHHIYVNKVMEEQFTMHPDVVANKHLFRHVNVTDVSISKIDYLNE